MTNDDQKEAPTQKAILVAARRARVLELRSQGWTIANIAAEIGCGEKTVRRDLSTIDAREYFDELMNRQLSDIETADLEIRLNYRDKLIEKLRPKAAPIQIQNKVEVENRGPSYEQLFQEYGDVLNAEIARREASSRETVGSDNKESVGPQQAPPQDGEKRPEP